MSVRTVEELSDHIAADLIWRKKELTVLKNLLRSAQPDGKTALLRSLVALLYAHWEGFIKSTSQRYLEYLSNRRLPYRDLTSNFIALSLEGRFRASLLQRSLSPIIELVDFLRFSLETRSAIPYKEGVEAESNLSSRVLHDITITLGIDYAPFETKSVLIDERLLNTRNRIAHGEYLIIDEDGALELAKEIQSMMEHFRNLVENTVVLGEYRNSS